jgi:lysophospholipase L1-like esterase
VLNRGVDGERTDQIAARFDRDALAHAPGVLVLLAGVNDVYQGRSVEPVQANLAAMYARARDARLPVVACAIIPYNTATADQNARMHAINAWIRAVASTTPGMAFCDTRAAVAAPGEINRLLDSPDDLHPSAAGYRRMADALLPVIRALLCGERVL